MKSAVWKRVAAVVILLLVVLLCPFPTTTAPAWHVHVVDQSGGPVRSARVIEHWGYVGIDIAEQVETRSTDQNGKVEFPRRFTWAPLAMRLGARGADAALEICWDKPLLYAVEHWDNSSREIYSRIVAKPVEQCGIL